jgi:hypothetical protein
LLGDIKLNKMNTNKLLILLLISGVYQSSIGQVTEAEKTLRTPEFSSRRSLELEFLINSNISYS